MLPELVERTLSTAMSYRGVREVGLSNTGTLVNKWLSEVGVTPGAPWCAAFVYSMGAEAAKALAVPNPLLRTAACEEIRAWAHTRGLLRDSPQAGDIFLRVGVLSGWYHAHHTGFVYSVTDGSWQSVEGNSNSEGSSDGYEVASNTRAVDAPGLVYVRWAAVCQPATEEQWQLLGPDGAVWFPVPVVQGKALAPARAWGQRLGFTVGWDTINQAVTYDGQTVAAEITLRNGAAYAGVRDLADAAALKLTVDDAGRRILVGRA